MTLQMSFTACRMPRRLFRPVAALLAVALASSACDGKTQSAPPGALGPVAGHLPTWLAQPDGAPAQGVLAQWGTD